LLGVLVFILPDTLRELREQGIPVEVLPRDKDDTDGQLALSRALALDPSEVLLVGFLGGPRLDHGLANVLLLSTSPPNTTLLDEQNECVLLRGGEERVWRAEPGEIVSLIPVGGDALGVQTAGMRWPLNAEILPLGTTRGVSNEPLGDDVGVRLEQGLLLVARHLPF
jgi:thiamine pyrophosphokinase